MKQKSIIFRSRSLWTYYSIFFAGTLVLVYQAQTWSFVGDSVNFLCLLSLLLGLTISKWFHLIENACLLTTGYILPLLIRNCLQMSYTEAPSTQDLIHLGLLSSLTTFSLGGVFSLAGFLCAVPLKRLLSLRKSAQAPPAPLQD